MVVWGSGFWGIGLGFWGWGSQFRGFWGFWGRGSLYKHVRITLGKNFTVFYKVLQIHVYTYKQKGGDNSIDILELAWTQTGQSLYI